jgi:hypothetical protein
VGVEVVIPVVMKSSIFWDIAPRHAVGPAYYLLHTGFLLGLFFNPEDGGNIFSPKRLLTFRRLHGVIFQKIKLFILTFV